MFDVITIGTATRDVFLENSLFTPVKDPHFTKESGFPTGEAECFAFGGKIDIGAPVFTTGGGSTNAAVAFARQDFNTAAIVSIGKDETGKAVMADLKNEKVKPLVSYHKTLSTSYSTILLSPVGERTILVYRGASDYLGRIASKNLHTKWACIFPGAIPVDRVKDLVSRLKEAGAMIAINPSGHYIKMGIGALKFIFDKVDVVILNREEASGLTSVAFYDERGIFKAMDNYVKGIVVITDGAKGVMVSDGRHIYKAGIFKEQKLVDRTGAGDAFGAGFVAGLLAKSNIKYQISKMPIENQKEVFDQEAIKYAIRLASANATSVVEYIGAKEGILTKARFENEERWKDLDIQIMPI